MELHHPKHFTGSSYHIMISVGLPTTKSEFEDNIKQLLSRENELLLKTKKSNRLVICFSAIHAIQLPIMIHNDGSFTINFDNITIVLLSMNESSSLLPGRKFELKTNSKKLSSFFTQ